MVESLNEMISKRIKEARKAAGLTQQDVGDYLGLTNAGYGMYENDKNQLSIEYLVKLSRLFKRPVTWFLGMQDEYTPDELEMLALYRQADKKYQKAAKIWLTL